MWNDHKSIVLSKICIVLYLCILFFTVVSAPWLTRWFLRFSRADLAGCGPYFLFTIYTGSIPAASLLILLFRLIRRIEAGQVFIADNVERLRKISWSCFAGAAVCLISVSYYFPWVFVAVSAAFMGLIVRVVKNVVAQAVALQDEVDFTI